MADDRQLQLAARGSDAWNQWRRAHPDTVPDLGNARLTDASLTGADLAFTNLFAADLSRARLDNADFNSANMMYAVLVDAALDGADFRQANLFAADLTRARLAGARFSGAHASGIKLKNAALEGANLFVADISRADLSGADLRRSNFFGSMLTGSNLSGADCGSADLSGADLSGALLAGVDFSGATLSDCRIKGLSAAALVLDGTVANDLVLSGEGEPEVAVDGLAAGLYLSSAINGVDPPKDAARPANLVMVLGRYPHERKGFLNGLREEVRKAGLTPLLFDLEGAGDDDCCGLVRLLARRSRFVIADLGALTELPPELMRLAAEKALPVQPILAGAATLELTRSLNAISGSGVVRHLFQTDDAAGMIMALGPKVINPLTRAS